MAQTQTIARTVTARKYFGDTPQTARVVLTIDWDELFQLIGTRAIYNRSGKARMLKGAIIAKVVKS